MSIRITPLTCPDRVPSGHRPAWLASDADGIPVGSAFLRVFTDAGRDHLAELTLAVHPAERRRGIGSRLLDAALAAAREHGRRHVVAQAEAGSPGDHFLPARGFRKALTLTYARLALDTVDAPALAGITGRPHPGYRLTSWHGTVPDHLAGTFAASRRAMDDMPMDDMPLDDAGHDPDRATVTWDVDRVREAARTVQERGELLHTVVAVDERDGSVAGFTELVVPGDGEGDAQHYGTGVLPGHRGHGLGRWMKAESIRRAHEDHPRLAGLLTDTADGNTYMRRINDDLGYLPTHKVLEYRLTL